MNDPLHYVTHGLRHCALGRTCPGQRNVVRAWYKRRAEAGHEPASILWPVHSCTSEIRWCRCQGCVGPNRPNGRRWRGLVYRENGLPYRVIAHEATAFDGDTFLDTHTFTAAEWEALDNDRPR